MILNVQVALYEHQTEHGGRYSSNPKNLRALGINIRDINADEDVTSHHSVIPVNLQDNDVACYSLIKSLHLARSYITMYDKIQVYTNVNDSMNDNATKYNIRLEDLINSYAEDDIKIDFNSELINEHEMISFAYNAIIFYYYVRGWHYIPCVLCGDGVITRKIIGVSKRGDFLKCSNKDCNLKLKTPKKHSK